MDARHETAHSKCSKEPEEGTMTRDASQFIQEGCVRTGNKTLSPMLLQAHLLLNNSMDSRTSTKRIAYDCTNEHRVT